MQLLKLLLVSILPVATLAAALPQEPTPVPTSEGPASTPAADDLLATAEKSSQGAFKLECENCTATLDQRAVVTWNEMSWDLGDVQGTSFVAIWSTGDFRFKTRFKNSNDWITWRYAIACGFRDLIPNQPSHAYVLSRTRNLGGDAIGGPSDTHDVDYYGSNPIIASNWEYIQAGDLILHCTASRKFDWQDLIAQVITTIKEYGPIVLPYIGLVG